ncbi:MAG: hypothetical protein AAFW64_00015 [Pseudomonadota bacterium]
MNRPKAMIPRRPKITSSRAARTPKEAAISLVRVEFDVSRLSMGIEQAEQRIRTYQDELGDKLRERERLIALIGDQGETYGRAT